MNNNGTMLRINTGRHALSAGCPRDNKKAESVTCTNYS